MLVFARQRLLDLANAESRVAGAPCHGLEPNLFAAAITHDASAGPRHEKLVADADNVRSALANRHIPFVPGSFGGNVPAFDRAGHISVEDRVADTSDVARTRGVNPRVRVHQQ